MRKLYPYQSDGLRRLRELGGSAALLMEMRLGKTLLLVRRLRELAPARILVIAPTTPLAAWMKELEAEGEPYVVARGSPSRRAAAAGSARWTLINYESAWRTPAIAETRWNAVVLDESTAIRNSRTRACKFVLKYLARVPLRFILTGDAQPQSLFDLWPQMAFVGGGSFMGFHNFWKWRDACGVRAGFEWIIKRSWKERIRTAAHEQAFLLTRQEAGIGGKKVRETRTHEMDPEAARLYRRAVTRWEIPGAETKHAVAVATWLRRIVGGHAPGLRLACWKEGETLDLLRGELSHQQVVVWFCFNAELARVWRALREARIPATWIAGEVALPERRQRIALFQEGRRRVVLAQVKCARMGVDLSSADAEIYYSSPWSFEDREQSEDRIVHPGKKNPLLVIDLVTENSVDEDVLEATRERRMDSAWFARKVMENRRHP